jgi:hypothetical protein
MSNMDVVDIKDEVDEPDYQTTSFNTSVKMSTYLLAFLVSDFDFTQDAENPSKISTKINKTLFKRITITTQIKCKILTNEFFSYSIQNLAPS